MADFDIAHKKMMETQGRAFHHTTLDNELHYVLCSDCFRDEGLKINAFQIGEENDGVCINCHSTEGRKLTKDAVRTVCYQFFVVGTIQRFDYGGCPSIQCNEQHFNNSEIEVSPWLVNDVKLIEQAGEIGLFYYGPRFWMFGEIEPLKELQDEVERDKVIDRILKTYPVKELSEQEYFYRTRLNPKVPHDVTEYDTAPDEFVGNNRLDAVGFPVLYASPDLELCVHECRATADDDLFVGKLVPAQKLKLLDLSVLILEENTTEFESLDMAIHFLFLAGKHAYGICRKIARKAYEYGYDGLIYPSYFSCVRMGIVPFDTVYGLSIRVIPQLQEYAQSQSVPNVALFGRPVREGKVTVDCINKVRINSVRYDLSFGPAFQKSEVGTDVSEYKNQQD